MKLIAGLGNPGGEYTFTRHNLGFLVVTALAEKHGAKFRNTAGIKGVSCEISIDGNNCSLLMPTTFMNNSGVAVQNLAAKKGVSPEEILVITDDLSLPFGAMRLRPSGSAGGHNGLKSIIECLGGNNFARLRLGIGSPRQGQDAADYVLMNFTSVEKKALPEFINRAADCVHSWVTNGAEQAMNEFNREQNKKEDA